MAPSKLETIGRDTVTFVNDNEYQAEKERMYKQSSRADHGKHMQQLKAKKKRRNANRSSH